MVLMKLSLGSSSKSIPSLPSLTFGIMAEAFKPIIAGLARHCLKEVHQL